MKNNSQTLKKKSHTPVWIWALTLVPVLSALLYICIVAGFLPFVKLEVISASGILILFAAIFVWGFCGYVFAAKGVEAKKAVLIANAFPMLVALVYTVFFVSFSLGAESLESAMYISAMCMGLFSYVGTFAYQITHLSLQSFEVYIDLIFVVFTFFMGYTIGKSKKLKA